MLMELSTQGGIVETAERIMDPDAWFYFPGNSRFILIGSCPNGDAIALDTLEVPGAVYYIDHERVHDDIPDRDRVVRVADTLTKYVDRCLTDPNFPQEYQDASNRT
jgi:hypothetical protein